MTAPRPAPTPARPRRTPASATPHEAPAGPAAQDSNSTLWWQPWSLLATQALGHWQHLAEQLQASEQHTLQQLQGDVQLEAQEAHAMSQPQDLLALQTTLAAEAATQLIGLGEQSFAAWLELQSRWWRDVEMLLAATLHPWQAPGSPGSAGALISPPEQASTSALLEAAGQAWPVAAQVVLNALHHDLQGNPVKH